MPLCRGGLPSLIMGQTRHTPTPEASATELLQACTFTLMVVMMGLVSAVRLGEFVGLF